MHFIISLIILISNISIVAAATCTQREEQVSVTFYGFPDNTPAGSGIECNLTSQTSCDACNSNGDPNNIITASTCGPRGEKAGGKGTFDDPLTMASAGKWFCHLEVVYLPYLRKYLRYEDYCLQCTQDAAKGKVTHIDIWTGSITKNGGKVQIGCENTLTPGDMQTMVRNPAPDLPVDSESLKNSMGDMLLTAATSIGLVYPRREFHLQWNSGGFEFRQFITSWTHICYLAALHTHTIP
jgi:hypothetical protein